MDQWAGKTDWRFPSTPEASKTTGTFAPGPPPALIFRTLKRFPISPAANGNFVDSWTAINFHEGQFIGIYVVLGELFQCGCVLRTLPAMRALISIVKICHLLDVPIIHAGNLAGNVAA